MVRAFGKWSSVGQPELPFQQLLMLAFIPSDPMAPRNPYVYLACAFSDRVRGAISRNPSSLLRCTFKTALQFAPGKNRSGSLERPAVVRLLGPGLGGDIAESLVPHVMHFQNCTTVRTRGNSLALSRGPAQESCVCPSVAVSDHGDLGDGLTQVTQILSCRASPQSPWSPRFPFETPQSPREDGFSSRR